jgi:hypothetical protein
MKPEELWQLNIDEFNQWRRENDLLKLFNCFQKTLPHFDEWLKEFNFTIEFILNTDKPGGFFYWDTETLLVKSTAQGFDDYFFVPIESEAHNKRLSKKSESDTAIEYRFMPYLRWAKNKLGKENIIESKYSSHDTFKFVLTNAPDSPESSNTFIAPGVPVLKLGGTTIKGWGMTAHVNLDFADLDFLVIKGKHHGSTQTDIFFSSCRNLIIKNSEVNFANFYGCNFKKLQSKNSRFYSVRFFKCDLFGADFENSSLVNFVIDNCSMSSFSFNRVEVDNLIYIPPKKNWYSGAALTYENILQNYKRLRVLYQNNGHRKEAGEAYFNERLYELKYNKSSVEFSRPVRLLYTMGYEYSKILIIENLNKAGAIVADSFSCFVWGFGERPFRTLISSMIILLFYAGCYFFSGINHINHDFSNSLYLSSIMFTTLGFGDFAPFQNGNFKIFMGSEALFGAFIFGLFIAGYANKSKY